MLLAAGFRPLPSDGVLREYELALPQPPADVRRHKTTITSRSLKPSGHSPAVRMTATISSTVGGSGG